MNNRFAVTEKRGSSKQKSKHKTCKRNKARIIRVQNGTMLFVEKEMSAKPGLIL